MAAGRTLIPCRSRCFAWRADAIVVPRSCCRVPDARVVPPRSGQGDASGVGLPVTGFEVGAVASEGCAARAGRTDSKDWLPC